MIKIAVGKGRISENFFKILASQGVKLQEGNSRLLRIYDTENRYQFSFIKPMDVPVYVETGTFDIGIVGIDSVWETGCEVYEIMDLGFSTCKLCVAGLKNEKAISDYKNGVPMKVATKYVNIAAKYFRDKNITKIIKLSGSVEVAPLQDLAQIIFDIVETGTTLRENGLEVYDEIYECSAVVIANVMSLKTKKEEIDRLIGLLR